ncbi:LPXTG cell wall anchor domain-containing protein [Aeromicrobium sp. Leaf245]|uniref:LPXTG cell wall anchor domain-containing protein n=1 Tax=Aeromicrobium sp. Leaf245 TaxID=1736306 RepID=UPI0006F21561|nr:LPXTG cell wall anchor domain-containing protein [Aeromicrobium sp. Leaf245]KQO38261.1 hypothetical protein ASF05_16545 [Aeromicrobium sp. Leaf245]
MRRARLLLAGLATTTLLGASVAYAADEIGLSDDGVTWSSGLDAPLFDPDVRWVPGDSRTESFYVRNEGPSGASLTIEARSADEDDLLADDDIDLRARADGGAWVELRNGVASARLTEREIEQDGVVQVDVNATFDPTSTNRSQVRRLALDLRVRLADAAGTDGESDADADGGADADLDGSGVDADLDPPEGEEAAGALPGTGTTTEGWILLLGAALVLGGTSLVVRRRGHEGVGR